MKKELLVKSLGSHGWEVLARCQSWTVDYVFTALCETYPNWSIRVEDSEGNLIMGREKA